MQCYSELTPPSAVTHSLVLPFVSAQSHNLVVAKSSLLQIFRTKVTAATATVDADAAQSKRKDGHFDYRLLHEDDGLGFLAGDSSVQPDITTSTKLVLVAESTLQGTITGLARIKTNKKALGGGDWLLMAFKDAKLSLVEWHAQKQGLSTISIHLYEQDELQCSPWTAPLDHYHNVLAVDPGSRCAALKFGPRNLAILPFKQSDEDIDMDAWDEELDGPKPVADLAAAAVDTNHIMEETPYLPSFVLRLSNLDPNLLHPVHVAFLHEYREPTFGILSSKQYASRSLGRKDHLVYMVFTLDLQQKASTTILSVTGLPQDLFRVVALPAPIGGVLLVGINELIHVDQSGKTHGVAVNAMAKQSTSFGLSDQARLDLRLEDCTVETLVAETGELLLVLNDGRMALVTLRMDGRTVSGVGLEMVPPEAGGRIIPCGIASLTRLGKSTLFVGLEDGDSLVLGWTRRHDRVARKKSSAATAGLDMEMESEDVENDDDDDDDLYGEKAETFNRASPSNAAAKTGEPVFRIHDRLVSIAPIRAMTFGKQAFVQGSEEEKNSAGVCSELQLVCAVGRDGASSLAVMNREIQPKIIGRFEFPEARGFWTMTAKRPVAQSIQSDKGALAAGKEGDMSNPYDKYMIVAKIDLDGYETSDVYALTATGFEGLTDTEFEPTTGLTIEAGAMGNNMRIVQVLKSEVRSYDGDLRLTQIIPMLDEDTGQEPRVTHAHIADPYLLLIRDDASVFVAQMDSRNEVEEMERHDRVLTSTKWVTGCLHQDTNGIFAPSTSDSGASTDDPIVMFLLSAAGALHLYRLPDLEHAVYVADGLSFIPPSLSADYTARKGAAREAITEILVADLGDATHKSPFLMLRHANDDLTLYQPVRTHPHESLSFQKIPNPAFAKEAAEADQDETAIAPRFLPMRACGNIAGYSTVFLPGPCASFVLKSAKSMPKVVALQGTAVQAMCSFHTGGCEHGFIYADAHGMARVAQLPTDASYAEMGVSVRKMPLGMDSSALAYHPPSRTYVLACSVQEGFELPKDDEYHKEWLRENLACKPVVERGLLRLVNPVTWTVVDTCEMEPSEVIMCVETLNLEVSESTNERRQLVAVGTALSKGEDLPTRGRVYVWDVAAVIPQPGRPETSCKLRLVAREDLPRGAVTAVCGVGSQGLMLVAQGQKCMVRGLKEDGALLPVAFMDMNCFVTSVKEVPGTGLCLISDAFKGVWLIGYTEEPYKMMLFGKSSSHLEVLHADFLPDAKELFIVAADADGHMHILQFDPEHPKSIEGHLLLHRTTFSTGAHHPTSSLLLPRAASILAANRSASSKVSDGVVNPQLLLLASPTGVLATLAPLSESSYRRLSSLATQLASSLPPIAGLNPKGYRMAAASVSIHPPGVDAGTFGRSVLDGVVLSRWAELGTGRRAEVAGRAGFTGPVEVRSELQGLLGWGGLDYF